MPTTIPDTWLLLLTGPPAPGGQSPYRSLAPFPADRKRRWIAAHGPLALTASPRPRKLLNLGKVPHGRTARESCSRSYTEPPRITARICDRGWLAAGDERPLAAGLNRAGPADPGHCAGNAGD